MNEKELLRVVIADDEPMIRNGLANNVPWEELGFTLVAACENGAEVLAATRSTCVDIVLVDIRMPGCSGIDVAQVLRREAPDIRVLFLTAYSDFEYAQAAIEHGVWRYLVKPIQYARLLSTLRELHQELTGRSPEDESAAASATGASTSADRIVRAVDEYIERNFDHASLADIAAALELTPEHVSRVYHQRSGRQFSDRLQDVRMREAARLLKSTRYRVAEISEMIGYSSPKNFTRRFRCHFGSSPRDYRLNED